MTHEGAPIFAAPDICNIFEIQNTSDALKDLEDDEKITLVNSEGNPRAGIPHQMSWLTEAGLYRMIFKSRKATARAFQRFVFHEVLPNFRKKGYYGQREQGILAFTRELLAMGLDSKDATKITLAAFPPLTRAEQKRAELEQANRQAGQLPALDEASAQLLALMEPGRPYQPAALLAKLPDTWANFNGTSARARIIDVDNTLALLVMHGRTTRVSGTQGAYALATDNVVAMTP